MKFDLLTEPAPAGFAILGATVELREIPYGDVIDFTSAEGVPYQERVLRMLGAVLHVDGTPIGYEGIRALPGHFAQDVNEAIAAVTRMHRLGPKDKDDDAPKA